MRLYSFVNGLYLRPIQAGIQTAHCVSELYLKSKDDIFLQNMYTTWARNGKTIIILDATNSSGLRKVEKFLSNYEDMYPTASFHEDEESLDNAFTATSIIVPDRVWVPEIEKFPTDQVLFDFLRSYPLYK